MVGSSNWHALEVAAPDFAARVRRRFAMGVNKTLATIRADGSPRISASELDIADGQVTFGMMAHSVKLADIRRDPRIAVHSPTVQAPPDVTDWPGDAKLAGLAVPTGAVTDPDHPGTNFRVELTEVVLTYLGAPADHLVVEWWSPAAGVRRCVAGTERR